MAIRTIEATPPDLHVGQIDVIKSLDENRYTIVCAGRRWGKSTLSLVSSVDQAFKRIKSMVDLSCISTIFRSLVKSKIIDKTVTGRICRNKRSRKKNCITERWDLYR